MKIVNFKFTISNLNLKFVITEELKNNICGFLGSLVPGFFSFWVLRFFSPYLLLPTTYHLKMDFGWWVWGDYKL